MSGQRFKNIYRAVFKIFAEALKIIKNYSKIIMGMTLTKSLVLEMTKKKTKKTFTASNLKRILVLFEAMPSK